MRPTFFVTAVCHQRRPVFRNEANASLLVETLEDYRQLQRYLLHEFVVMHDHIHLIITPANFISLEKAMQFVKGGFSFQAGKVLGYRGEIWQRSFTHEQISSADAYAGFRRYVRENPLKRGYANVAAEYGYSSANTKYVLDPAPEYLRG